jgi:hypothetical protein
MAGVVHGKEKNMTIEEVEFWPADEVKKLMRAFEEAKEKRDVDSLAWCADRLLFLYRIAEEGEIEPGAEQMEVLFNAAFRDGAPKPPALIAGIMTGEEPEPVTTEDAGEALETLREFIAENMAKKGLPEALENLAALRDAVAALAGEEA